MHAVIARPWWTVFRRARARWGVTMPERARMLVGGIRLLVRAAFDPKVPTNEARYLRNMGARALGMAVNPASTRPEKR